MTPFRVIPAIFAATILSCLVNATSSPAQATDLVAPTTAFIDVNVIPMDAERVLENHTVIIEGSRITALGPAVETKIPDGARVIDGKGAYLMPGLADMHMHLTADPSPDFLKLFLAEGVTTIRNFNGLPEHQVWQAEVRAGKRVGPTIYTAGPVIAGLPEEMGSMRTQLTALIIVGPVLVFSLIIAIAWLLARRSHGDAGIRKIRRAVLPGVGSALVVGLAVWWSGVIPINAYTSLFLPEAKVADTPEQARRHVRREVEDGYDFIKIYDYLTEAAYLAALEEAEKLGKYTVSHLNDTLPLERMLETGLDEIAHVDEFLEQHMTGHSTPNDFQPLPINMDTIPASVATAKAHDVMVVSNLVADENAYEYLEAGPEYFDRPEFANLRPETKAGWLRGRVVHWQGTQVWRRNALQPLYVALIVQLHAAEVPLLVGTDTDIDGIMPEHLHRDIELLVAAGLSPYEALKAATANAGISVNRMGINDSFGQIAEGMRADLILVRENPLTSVSATRVRIGVMARGIWYTQEQIDDLVSEFVSDY